MFMSFELFFLNNNCMRYDSDSYILTQYQAFLDVGDLLISTDINAALESFKTVSAF